MPASPRRRPTRRFRGFELLESRAVPAVVFSPAAAAEVQADSQDFAAGGASSFLLDQYRVVDNHGTLHLVTSGGGSTFDQNYSNVITRVGGTARGGFTASNSVDFFLHELLARSADPANGDGSDFSSLGVNLLNENYNTSGDTTTFDLVYTAGGYRFDQHFTMQATPDSSTGSYTSADAINTFAADLDAHRNEFLNWKYPASSGTTGTGTSTATGTGSTGTSTSTGTGSTSSFTQYSRTSNIKPGTSLGTYGYTIGYTGGAGAGSTSIATGTTIGTGVTTGTGSNGTGNTTGTGTLTGTGTTTSGIGTTGTGSGTNIGPGTTGTGLGTGTIGTGSGTGIGSGITGTGSGIGTGTTSQGTGIGTGTTGTGVGTGITGQGSTISPSGAYDLGTSSPSTADNGIVGTAATGAGSLSTLAAPGTPLLNPGPAITSDNGGTLGT